MSEPSQHSSDRAERAVRAALRVHADDVDFVPLDPLALERRWAQSGEASTTRSRMSPVWLAVAAVAVVAFIIPLGTVLVRSSGDPSAQSAGSQVEAVPADPATAEQTGVGDAATTAVSFLDVVIDVPSDWGYGFAPGEDWCRGYVRPDAPFVDRDPLAHTPVTAPCGDDIPDELRQTSLTWRRLKEADVASTVQAGSWAQVSRPIGSAFVTVQVPRESTVLATQILDTARVVVTDPRGCASHLDPGRPSSGPLTDVRSVNEVAVCQYIMDGSAGPNLYGSYALYGDQAQQVLDSMMVAPEVESPPEATCDAGGSTLVVRFGGGVRQVRIDLSPCGVNLLDDGAVYRAPTRSTCADLIYGPLWVADAPSSVTACLPE